MTEFGSPTYHDPGSNGDLFGFFRGDHNNDTGHRCCEQKHSQQHIKHRMFLETTTTTRLVLGWWCGRFQWYLHVNSGMWSCGVIGSHWWSGCSVCYKVWLDVRFRLSIYTRLILGQLIGYMWWEFHMCTLVHTLLVIWSTRDYRICKRWCERLSKVKCCWLMTCWLPYPSDNSRLCFGIMNKMAIFITFIS